MEIEPTTRRLRDGHLMKPITADLLKPGSAVRELGCCNRMDFCRALFPWAGVGITKSCMRVRSRVAFERRPGRQA